MPPEQRKVYIKKILKIEESSRDVIETWSLSIQPDNLKLNVPPYKLQEIWKRAEIIQANYKVLELCVTV